MSRGVEPDLAREVARQLSQDPEQALEIHAREELGIDPSDLPSPTVAAVSSFGSFALGALLPLLPYLLGATALWPAVLLALVGLFGCGAVVARVTARSWWFSGLRQLALGGAAAALTFGLGAPLRHRHRLTGTREAITRGGAIGSAPCDVRPARFAGPAAVEWRSMQAAT